MAAGTWDNQYDTEDVWGDDQERAPLRSRPARSGENEYQSVIPEARGKAEVLSSLLATGGRKDARGLYTKGRFKGMSQQQAVQLAEAYWAVASAEDASGASRDNIESQDEVGEYEEPIILPEGRGKAEAMRTFLAGGGGLTGMGYYRQGRLKGKTQQQAEEEFERLWSGADGAVKDKYANRAMDALAPSERARLDAGEKKRQGMPLPNRPGQSVPSAEGRLSGLPMTTALPERSGRDAGGRAGAALGSAPAAGPKMPLPSTMATSVGPSGMGPKAESDSDYSAIADQRRATGYPAETRSIPFTGVDVTRSQDSGHGSNPTPTGATPGASPRINRLTGLPIGYRPGDALPAGASPAMQSAADQSVRRQQSAAAAALPIPRATPAPATDQYEAARSRYQAGNAPASEMDGIYRGSSGVDQAKIVGNSLKRAGRMPLPGRAAPSPTAGGPRMPLPMR